MTAESLVHSYLPSREDMTHYAVTAASAAVYTGAKAASLGAVGAYKLGKYLVADVGVPRAVGILSAAKNGYTNHFKPWYEKSSNNLHKKVHVPLTERSKNEKDTFCPKDSLAYGVTVGGLVGGALLALHGIANLDTFDLARNPIDSYTSLLSLWGGANAMKWGAKTFHDAAFVKNAEKYVLRGAFFKRIMSTFLVFSLGLNLYAQQLPTNIQTAHAAEHSSYFNFPPDPITYEDPTNFFPDFVYTQEQLLGIFKYQENISVAPRIDELRQRMGAFGLNADNIVKAIILQESKGDPTVRNGNCVGLGGVNLDYYPLENWQDPQKNIDAIVAILLEKTDYYPDDPILSIQAYFGIITDATGKFNFSYKQYGHLIADLADLYEGRMAANFS